MKSPKQISIAFALAIVTVAIVARADEQAASPVKTAHFRCVSESSSFGPNSGLSHVQKDEREMWISGDRERMERVIEGVKNVCISVGSDRYYYRTDTASGSKRKMSDEKPKGVYFLSLLQEVQQKWQLTDAETVVGETCDKYQSPASYQEAFGSSNVTVWISRRTNFPTQVMMEDKENGTTRTYNVLFKNVELNVNLPEELFTVPKNISIVDKTPAK